MKQLHKILITAAIALSLAVPAASILAQEGGDLGIQSSGLLPSNPFYFLKEWGRGFRKLITPSAVRKAELDLDVLNEKAAELKKLDEIAVNNVSGLSLAVDSYLDSLAQLQQSLEAISDEPGSANLNDLAENLIFRSLRHFRLLEDLLNKYSTEAALIAKLQKAVDGLAAVLADAPVKLVLPRDFKAQFIAAVGEINDPFRELRSADLADRLEGILSDDAKDAAASLREDLLLQFGGRLEGSALAGGGLGDLAGLSGDRLRRLRLIDEVRETILNPQLRNELNILRQKILSKVEEGNGIGEEQAKQAIADAQNLVTEAEAKIAERSSVKSSIKELLDRAKFNLSQAEQFFAGENFGGAFGQATAAQAALKNLMNQLTPTAFDAANALEEVKKSFDYWSAKVREAGLTNEQNPKIFALLDEAERRIVALEKLIEKQSAPETIAAALKPIKILLATIEEFFNQIQNPNPVEKPDVLQSTPVNEAGERVPVKTTSVLQPEAITIYITDTGFEPPVIKITKGTKVVWVNKDIRPHWPALVPSSAPRSLTGFDALQGLSQNESYFFVFDQVGSWKYQDHLNPEMRGSVEVSE